MTVLSKNVSPLKGNGIWKRRENKKPDDGKTRDGTKAGD